jgi:hypothetical protein
LGLGALFGGPIFVGWALPTIYSLDYIRYLVGRAHPKTVHYSFAELQNPNILEKPAFRQGWSGESTQEGSKPNAHHPRDGETSTQTRIMERNTIKLPENRRQTAKN